MLGWLAYSAIGITINLLSGAKLLPLAIGHVLLISVSIGLTHLLRRQIQLRRQTDRRVGRVECGPSWRQALSQSVLFRPCSHRDEPFVGGGRMDRHRHRRASGGDASGDRRLDDPVCEVHGAAGGTWHAKVNFNSLLREAELRALEAQVNPHFLFNQVPNSDLRARRYRPARCAGHADTPCKCARNSLRHDRQHTVQLAAEIEAVSDYVALEAIRFEERLRSEIAVDAAAAHCLVPPMLLQTLVENAIKHGISQVTGRGRSDRSRPTGERLRLALVVENTGRLTGSPGSPAQLGLGNVRERLRLLYGDEASLSLDDAEGMVRATVLIPVSG